MTPKEKAKELVDKLLLIQEKIEWGNIELKMESGLIYEKNNIEYNKYYDELAKQCALIAVNEIIKALRKDLPKIGLGKGYWFNVIQEIEKL